MIVLDTHAWIWWVHDDSRLSNTQVETIKSNENEGIGISAISCWEIAKLVELGRLKLPCPLTDWFTQALNYPGICLLELTPEVSIESTTLPGEFHRDPADQIIVATARLLDCPLITADERIQNYPFVKAIK